MFQFRILAALLITQLLINYYQVMPIFKTSKGSLKQHYKIDLLTFAQRVKIILLFYTKSIPVYLREHYSQINRTAESFLQCTELFYKTN